MNLKLLILFSLLLTAARGQEGFIPKFPLSQNPVELTRISQPGQYFDKIGRKAAVMGFESGSFELWIWPWKPLRNFELQFFLGSSTIPIRAGDITKEISVTPEATVITFTYESFTVKEIIFVPVHSTAVVILLDVYTVEPLSIVPGFIPVMQPQWPAGIGGQYSYWDDNMKAFVISESQQRGLFLCGSPLGKQMSAPPAHMFADNPLQFRIDVTKEDAYNGYIPIIITGSPVKTKYDSVKSMYRNVLSDIKKLYEENVLYYKDLRESTVTINTPVKKLDLALEWGKVGLHNLLVENPNLGRGLVAGYGLSGGGGRPGFAWFFGGDTYINSLALNSLQDFKTVRDGLLFTQKWQRQDNYPIRKRTPGAVNNDIGKMSHELSQSEGLVDWWNDYHYGYNHADTTPWYLVSAGDYYRSSGDIQFVKDSWNSLKQAFKWCIGKDSNNDGLMDLKGAGLGVLEFGSLVNIHNDIYTQVLWTQGLKNMVLMSSAAGDDEIKKEAEELLAKAVPALEKLYWMQDLGFYSFGANQEGKQVREKSIYSSSALFFRMMDETKSINTLNNFNNSEMMTGWGVRNLSNKSGLYNPSNYNYGTVWPFTSYMIGTSEYNYNFSLQGYSILCNTVENLYRYGLGVCPEVLSGDINNKLGEAYHNQGFSYSGFLLPLLRGLFGIETDAVNNRIIFAPKLPSDWDDASVKNIKVGNSTLSFIYARRDNVLEWKITSTGENNAKVYFNPVLPPGSEVSAVTLNGKPLSHKSKKRNYCNEISAELITSGESIVSIAITPVPEIYILQDNSKSTTNKSLIINSHEYSNGQLILVVEGIAGEEYHLGIRNPGLVSRVEGAELKGNMIRFNTGNDDASGYTAGKIIINTKD